MAQLQEPYSSVGYLCERTPFLSVLKLKHPSIEENKSQQGQQGSEELSWTAWDVCDGKPLLCDIKHQSKVIEDCKSVGIKLSCSEFFYRRCIFYIFPSHLL